MSNLAQEAEVPDWTLGWRLRRSLEHAGISAQQMADTLGVTPSTISRWGRDEVVPRRLFLVEWAKRCEVSYDWLVTGEPPPPPRPRGSRRPDSPKAGNPDSRNHSYPYLQAAA